MKPTSSAKSSKASPEQSSLLSELKSCSSKPTMDSQLTFSQSKDLCSLVLGRASVSYYRASGFASISTRGQSAVVRAILSLTTEGREIATLRITLPIAGIAAGLPLTASVGRKRKKGLRGA